MAPAAPVFADETAQIIRRTVRYVDSVTDPDRSAADCFAMVPN
jgi:hypothetical protein